MKQKNRLIAAVLSIAMIVTLFSFPAGVFAAEEKDEGEFLLLDTSKKADITKTVTNVTADSKTVRNNKYSAKWDMGAADGIVVSGVPKDITAYNELKMTVYATHNVTAYVYLTSDNPNTDGMDYYGQMLNFSTGWQDISIDISKLGKSREPSYANIKGLEFNCAGWGQTKNPEAALYFDSIFLAKNSTYATLVAPVATPTPTPLPDGEAGVMRYYENDFEADSSLSGVNEKDNSVTRAESKGNHYMLMTKKGKQDMHVDTKINNASRYVILRGDFATTQLPQGNAQLITCKSATGQFTFVSLDKEGTIKAAGQEAGKLKADGKFVNVAVAGDFANNTYNVYINEKKVLTDLKIGTGIFGYPTLYRVFMSAGEDNGANLMVDNIKIYDGIELSDYENTLDAQTAAAQGFKDMIGKPSPIIENCSAIVSYIDQIRAVCVNVRSGYIYANGKRSLPDAAPYIKNGRTLLPVRAVSEALNCKVEWDEASKTVTVNDKAKIVIGSNQMTLPNGTGAALDVPAEITNNRTFIPLRALCEQILGKTVFWDDRGLIVLSDAPLDLTEANVISLNNYMLYTRPSADELKNLFNTVNKNTHPRIMLNQERFDRIIEEYNSNEIMKSWGDQVIKDAETKLKSSHEKYVIPDGLRLLSTCRAVLGKVTTLSMAYKLTGDTRYIDYLWEEIQNAGNFPDWNHKLHYLDTGEMTAAFAIAYDWLYDIWNDEQKKFMEEAIYKHGLVWTQMALYGQCNYPNFFVTANTNWNAVCNGGTGMGAIAVFDKYPDICSDILEKNYISLEKMMTEFYPDGAWYEGPGYWEYLMQYLVYFMSTSEITFNTDFNICKAPGFEKSGNYYLDSDGITGSNNFHDAGTSHLMSNYLFWFAEKFNNPGLAEVNLYKKEKYNSAGGVYGMIYYNTDVTPAEEVNLALDSVYRSTEIANLRSSWINDAGMYVSFHSGQNRVNHAHLDAGTFVADLGGQRFAGDIGAEDYNIDGYWGSKRYIYYRARPEGHNTIVINPDNTLGQDLNGSDKISKFESKPRGAFAISPLTSSYKAYANSVERGIMLTDDRRSIVIRDEIRQMKKDINTVYWFMQMERVDTEIIDKNTAILSKNGVKVKLQVLSDADECEITVTDPVVMETSENLPNQNKNANWKRLAIKFTSGKDLNINVKMSLLEDPLGDTPIKDVALRDWKIEDGEIPALPKLDMLYADGVKIEGFDKNALAYRLTVPYDREGFPQYTYDVSDKYSVEVINPDDFTGTTKIKVTDKENPAYFDIYSIGYKVIAKPVDVAGMTRYAIQNVTASDNPQAENVDVNVLDGDIETRWAVDGKDQWIRLDLGEVKPIDNIGVMVWKATERDTIYSIEISEDGTNWTQIFNGQSSGIADNKYDFYETTGKKARFVRLTCQGTSAGSWTSILEIAVLAKK